MYPIRLKKLAFALLLVFQTSFAEDAAPAVNAPNSLSDCSPVPLEIQGSPGKASTSGQSTVAPAVGCAPTKSDEPAINGIPGAGNSISPAGLTLPSIHKATDSTVASSPPNTFSTQNGAAAKPEPASPNGTAAQPEPASPNGTAAQPEPASPNGTAAQPEPASPNGTAAKPDPASPNGTAAKPDPASPNGTAAQPDPASQNGAVNQSNSMVPNIPGGNIAGLNGTSASPSASNSSSGTAHSMNTTVVSPENANFTSANNTTLATTNSTNSNATDAASNFTTDNTQTPQTPYTPLNKSSDNSYNNNKPNYPIRPPSSNTINSAKSTGCKNNLLDKNTFFYRLILIFSSIALSVCT